MVADKVFLKGIVLEKSHGYEIWKKSSQMMLQALANFWFGVDPKWDDSKTSLMMRICHMTEDEVMKMVRDNSLKPLPGLLNRIEGEMQPMHKRAKIKIQVDYFFE